MKWLVSLFAAFAFTAVALAQCSGGRCYAQPEIAWYAFDHDPNRAYLFRGNEQLGAWCFEYEHWRDYNAQRDVWGPTVAEVPSGFPALPEPPPAFRGRNFGVQAEKLKGERLEMHVEEKNFGVQTDKLKGGRVHEATPDEVDRAIKQIPDDSKKFRLVLTGPDREQIKKDFAKTEPDLQSRVVVWSVPPDHWSLKDTVTGETVFKTGGITFQAPDGRVLHRQADYTGPQDFEAIRKATKAYDSGKDKDLRKPENPVPVTPGGGFNVPMWALVLLVGGAFVYWQQNRKKEVALG